MYMPPARTIRARTRVPEPPVAPITFGPRAASSGERMGAPASYWVDCLMAHGSRDAGESDLVAYVSRRTPEDSDCPAQPMASRRERSRRERLVARLALEAQQDSDCRCDCERACNEKGRQRREAVQHAGGIDERYDSDRPGSGDQWDGSPGGDVADSQPGQARHDRHVEGNEHEQEEERADTRQACELFLDRETAEHEAGRRDGTHAEDGLAPEHDRSEPGLGEREQERPGEDDQRLDDSDDGKQLQRG